MQTVTIFLTSELGDRLEDFIHDDVRFTFDRIDSAGPKRLAEGTVWAFIDWVMDDMAGLELCRRLRADPRMADAHITMVLEADDAEDRRRALKAGADDYMVGPVDRTAILDRVMALRSPHDQHQLTQVITHGRLTIDLAALQARWNDIPLAVRPNEFRLLRFLAENADRVLSRKEIIAGLGKQEPPIDERTVDVWIGRLRRALREAGAGNPLRTVRAMGYVLDTQ